MIVIKYKLDKNDILDSIYISGHAGFKKKGEDIVCAGVSAVVQCMINGLIYNYPKSYRIEQTKDSIEIEKKEKLNNKNDIHVIWIMFIKTIKQINDRYPKYLYVKEI